MTDLGGQRVPEILLVDDEHETCEEIAEFLECHGFACHVADSVDKALLTLDARPAIRVVLTDLRMPHRSGFDLLAAVVAENAGRKVIVMTGHADQDDAERSMRCGAMDFHTKPVDPHAVLRSVRFAFAGDGSPAGAA